MNTVLEAVGNALEPLSLNTTGQRKTSTKQNNRKKNQQSLNTAPKAVGNALESLLYNTTQRRKTTTEQQKNKRTKTKNSDN